MRRLPTFLPLVSEFDPAAKDEFVSVGEYTVLPGNETLARLAHAPAFSSAGEYSSVSAVAGAAETASVSNYASANDMAAINDKSVYGGVEALLADAEPATAPKKKQAPTPPRKDTIVYSAFPNTIPASNVKDNK